MIEGKINNSTSDYFRSATKVQNWRLLGYKSGL